MIPLLNVQHLAVHLNSKVILRDVSFSVTSEQIVTIIGPNGAGKSTLLKALLGLVPIYSGECIRKPGLQIGYMPQHWVIEPFMPLPVIRFLTLAGPTKKNLQAIIEQMGISSLLSFDMHTLSGGERQRVLLARALLRQPDLLILDEPLQGVDVKGQEELYRLIAEIKKRQRCGIVLVSHDLHLVMAQTDFVVCLNQHVCCAGHPEAISRDPEFLKLLGFEGSQAFAIYKHEHDHDHSGHLS